MLVAPRVGDAVLVVPRLEAPRVTERPDVFRVDAWEETDDPVARVAALVGNARSVAIGDHTWARFVLALQAELPDARSRPPTPLPLRCVRSRTPPRSTRSKPPRPRSTRSPS